MQLTSSEQSEQEKPHEIEYQSGILIISESAIYTLINKLITTDEQILHFNIILNNVMQRNHYNETWAKFPPFYKATCPELCEATLRFLKVWPDWTNYSKP